MKKELCIKIGPTRAIVDYGKLPSPACYFAESELHTFCKKNLTCYDFDRRTKTYRPSARYFIQDKRLKVYTIPAPFVTKLVAHFRAIGYELTFEDLPAHKLRQTKFKMNPSFKDKPHQIEAIKFLLDNKSERSGLELQTGSVRGDTLIKFRMGDASRVVDMPIAEAYHRWHGNKADLLEGNPWDRRVIRNVLSFTGSIIEKQPIMDILFSGLKHTWEIKLSSGHALVATADHEILTIDGDMIPLSKLVGHQVAYYDTDSRGITRPRYSNVISIEDAGIHETYDICCVAPHHNFVANGIVISNSGKAQPLDAKIKVPGGWSTMGDMKVGTKVITPTGCITRVIAVHPQGKKTIYRVTFADGRSTECCGEHLWEIHNNTWDEPRLLQTTELINKIGSTMPAYTIPLVSSENNKDASLPIPPYVLGALLGDGHLGLRHICFSSSEDEILSKIRTLLPNSLKLIYRSGVDFGISSGLNSNPNEYLVELRNMGLCGALSADKFIPELYKSGSTEQRLEILRGLLDTDGTVDNRFGKITYSSASMQLIEDIRYLVRSLGGSASMQKSRVTTYTHKGEKRKGQRSYSTNIRYKNPRSLFTLRRKRDRVKEPTYLNTVTKLRIAKIEEVGEKEAQCISVASTNGLYVTDDFIVTHNTYSATKAACLIGDVVMIVVEGLVDQWVSSMQAQTNIGDDVYVIQGFNSLKKLLNSDIKPDAFVVSLGTLRKYVKYEGNYKNLMPYSKFVKHYGIGIKIVDEAHRCLHATSLIDMAADVPTNIYLTATFLTGNRMLRNIFSTYFPNQMRYDDGYTKYADVFGYDYHSGITTNQSIAYGNYSHNKVEKIRLFKKGKLFYPFINLVLVPLIERHFIEKEYPGKKLLIFFALKQTIRETAEVLQTRYPQFKVVTYLHEDPESNLDEGDIILSTHKGAGTGTDISDLIAVINTVSFLAETTAKQIFGRLRKLPNFTPTYVDLYDGRNSIQNRHWFTRRRILKACSKAFTELST